MPGVRVWSKGEVGRSGGPPGVRAAAAAGVVERQLVCPTTVAVRVRSPSRTPWIASERELLTCRAGRWAAQAVEPGGARRCPMSPASWVDWHTVNKKVVRWVKALLEANEGRIGAVEAICC